ncbi:MAG: class 1 fructose-bisphosphatase [Phycisphaeraceae bacterium]|nr:class 1 fructose-bisphosphatase [Phycisphaeraceae bacterium]MDG2134372.1 class 1 fructose-bisphosphatase [Phycisphaerales bacterium]MCP4011811.1 class 1 fructose-bisphosphatase [Phycisphaeraceae bacterium]MCP4069743.1 class 1 fructose-bisphosphatase [Phycisphaeraceae bacterium]MCP4497196.1 class 1 fructose-bisphosphatase [Phycisphaeraceae bacterium]
MQHDDDLVHQNLMSLQTHVLAEEAKHPGATGDLSWIISAISLAGKTIANKVRRARLDDVLGAHGTENVQGEDQLKMDVISNEIIMRCLGDRASIAVLASEEDEEPRILRRSGDGGKYCVLFDPLDGSSNLDSCVGVGTIFSVTLNDPAESDGEKTVCQPGTRQVAAGYILYGSSTIMCLTTGDGVDMFVLDQAIGSFLRVRTNVRIPEQGTTYSINEANAETFPEGYQAYLRFAHGAGYTSRYIGSMVSDVHRTLIRGGVFLYPPTAKNPDGKLRLLYEANPMAMLMEQAGGVSYSGDVRTMEVRPERLHQRVPVLLGSPAEVAKVREFM